MSRNLNGASEIENDHGILKYSFEYSFEYRRDKIQFLGNIKAKID